MTRIRTLFDENAVVAGDVLGNVAQQREVDSAYAALRNARRVSISA